MENPFSDPRAERSPRAARTLAPTATSIGSHVFLPTRSRRQLLAAVWHCRVRRAAGTDGRDVVVTASAGGMARRGGRLPHEGHHCHVTFTVERLPLCRGRRGLAAGCTYYQVAAPAPRASVFDRSWNAALGAMDDTGVAISSADRNSGMIRGPTTTGTATIGAYTQADGSVRVEITALGPAGVDTALAQRLSDAYDRRMGR